MSEQPVMLKILLRDKHWQHYSTGRMGVVSDTARLPWFWSGLSVVSGLGPGLTC
jgi:hypothetical protein